MANKSEAKSAQMKQTNSTALWRSVNYVLSRQGLYFGLGLKETAREVI